MRKVTVEENQKEVFVFTIDSFKEYDGASEDYSQYWEYFRELLACISNISPVFSKTISLVLNVDDFSTLLTLYLTEEQMPFIEKVKNTLLEEFSEDIEQIGIKDNQLNIMDFLYEFNA